MPRFHFHLVSECARVLDSEGIVLADDWSARREAVLVAHELVKPGSAAQHRKWQGWSVQVVDGRNSEVMFVPVVELLGARSPARRGDNRDPAPDRTNRVQRRARTEAYSDNIRLAAEAIRHVERCRQLKRSIDTQIELARETARLSAQLLEQWRSLPGASASG